MIDVDVLVLEYLKEQQRQRDLVEESRRLRLPIPEPYLKPRETQREPKRVIEIQI